jgi:hypothetical protein
MLRFSFWREIKLPKRLWIVRLCSKPIIVASMVPLCSEFLLKIVEKDLSCLLLLDFLLQRLSKYANPALSCGGDALAK